MFVVNVTFCLIVSVLLTFVLVAAESSMARGNMLADTEIAVGRTSGWAAAQPSSDPALR